MTVVLKWNNPKLPGCSLNLMLVYLEMAGERDMEQNRVMKPQVKDSEPLTGKVKKGSPQRCLACLDMTLAQRCETLSLLF